MFGSEKQHALLQFYLHVKAMYITLGESILLIQIKLNLAYTCAYPNMFRIFPNAVTQCPKNELK